MEEGVARLEVFKHRHKPERLLKMRAKATVTYDDISATFSATMVKDDYGVPGSPTWWTPEDITLEEVTILDVTFSGKKELDTLPDKLVEALYEMITDEEEWEE